jgi:hypothetical protein
VTAWLLLAGAVPGGRRGPQVAGHRGAVRGSRRACRAAARKGASEAAAPQRRDPRVNLSRLRRVTTPRLFVPVPRCSRPGRQPRRAEGAPLMNVTKVLTTPRPSYALVAMCNYNVASSDSRVSYTSPCPWLIRPVEPCPNGSGGVVSVDAPLVGESANDVQSVVSGQVNHPLVPNSAMAL